MGRASQGREVRRSVESNRGEVRRDAWRPRHTTERLEGSRQGTGRARRVLRDKVADAVEQASFAVLKAHDVPSILVETAFISNPQEEKRLNDQRYQDKLARALLEGIRDFVTKHPPRPASPLAKSF